MHAWVLTYCDKLQSEEFGYFVTLLSAWKIYDLYIQVTVSVITHFYINPNYLWIINYYLKLLLKKSMYINRLCVIKLHNKVIFAELIEYMLKLFHGQKYLYTNWSILASIKYMCRQGPPHKTWLAAPAKQLAFLTLQQSGSARLSSVIRGATSLCAVSCLGRVRRVFSLFFLLLLWLAGLAISLLREKLR